MHGIAGSRGPVTANMHGIAGSQGPVTANMHGFAAVPERSGSAAHGEVRARRQPRTATRSVDGGQLEQPLDPVPVSPVRLEQLRQTVVVHGGSGERPTDVL